MNQHAGDKFNWALLVADFFSRICFEPLVLTSSKSVVVFFFVHFRFQNVCDKVFFYYFVQTYERYEIFTISTS
jgi:hypothetical protein